MSSPQPNLSPSIVMAPNRLAPLHADCRAHWRKVGVAQGAAPFERQTFDLYQCQLCGLGFTDPIPTEETSYLLYANREESTQFSAEEASFVARIKRRASVKEAKSFCWGWAGGGTFLDFGCGNGAFALGVREAFPHAKIVAADQHKSAPNEAIAPMYVPYDSLADKRESFEFIACRHVLEHSYDPVGLVRYLGSLLVPGGVLAIEVPSFETKLRGVFGKYWDLYYAPYHTVHYTAVGLKSVVESGGLTMLREAGSELPKMGRNIQNVLGCGYSLGLFTLGVLLHPLQVGIGKVSGTSVCLRLWARRN